MFCCIREARKKDEIEFVFQDGCVDCDLKNPIVAKQVELMKRPGELSECEA